jgi:hypothetical protein
MGRWVLAAPGGSAAPPASAGITPAATGWTTFYTGGAPNALNTTSGANVTMVAGTLYYAALFVPCNTTLTGLTFVVGTTGGTDKWIAALYTRAGQLVANSALAGVTAGTAQTKQSIPFTAPIAVTGPAPYLAVLQSNGTTANFRAFGNSGEQFATGSTAGTFGTLPALTLSGNYNLNVGPFGNTY